MHKLKREPAAPRKVEKRLHIVPLAIGPKNYSKYLKDHNITHVVGFEHLPKDVLKSSSEKRVYTGQFPMSVGSVPVEVPNHYGIGLHGVRLVPHESFSDQGRKNLLKGAQKAYDLIKEGNNVAFSCTFGTRRSSRGYYIFLRMKGYTHEEAMKNSKALGEEAEKLKETWENRQKYLDS